MLLTNEDLAVGAACHLNLRCIVKQINPALSTLECVSCLGITHIAEKFIWQSLRAVSQILEHKAVPAAP